MRLSARFEVFLAMHCTDRSDLYWLAGGGEETDLAALCTLTTTTTTVPFELVRRITQWALEFLGGDYENRCRLGRDASLTERYQRFEETFYQNAQRNIQDDSNHVHLEYKKMYLLRLIATTQVFQSSNLESLITGVIGSTEHPTHRSRLELEVYFSYQEPWLVL
jgi:hypothetical protein